MRWTVEFSDEVRSWYLGLSPAGRATADRILERLASQGNMLRMPHSRSLGGGLYELRFACENVSQRITYVFELDRRAVTLTAFRKRRQNERGEILRARRAQAACQAADATRKDATKKEGRGTMSTSAATTSWEQVREESLAAMTEAERAEYDAASIEAEARLQLAELVYTARTAAGLSQTELARRAHTRQAVISAIESGAQAPGGIMLARIAHALGGTLSIHVAA